MNHVSTMSPAERLAATIATAALLASVVAAYLAASPGWWQLAVFGLGPDLAFVLGLERGLARGRMSSRAVPLYNLLHRPALPVLLAALAVAGVLPRVLVVGALVWALHIAVDRAAGYRLRREDGWQR